MIGEPHGRFDARAKRGAMVHGPRLARGARQMTPPPLGTVIAEHDQARSGLYRASDGADRAIEPSKRFVVLRRSDAVRVRGHVTARERQDNELRAGAFD